MEEHPLARMYRRLRRDGSGLNLRRRFMTRTRNTYTISLGGHTVIDPTDVVDFVNTFRRRYGNRRRRPRPIFRDWNFLGRWGATEESTGDSAEPEVPELPKEPELPEAKEEELLSVLHVKSLDLQVKVNSIAHHTERFDQTESRTAMETGEKLDPELVIRRGQEFTMTVAFDRPYDVENDDMTIVFSIGDKPLQHKGTKASIVMSEHRDTNYTQNTAEWAARLVATNEHDVTLAIYVPVTAIIGEWDIKILTMLAEEEGEGPKLFEYEHSDDIIILFNPWCSDDQVYMSSTSLLDEYVLNDYGCLFYGNHSRIGTKPWFFGQFEDGILDVTLHLLRKAFNFNTSKHMANPVRIARALSRIVNSNDDNGVITGNWSGEYSLGTAPLKWIGSVKILKQYYKNREPVSYGQCWVFAGVLTTVCRALGLPCRPVSNFRSAHDSDANVTIDKHFRLDVDNNRVNMTEYDNDSIWNFHVWNDAWMSRPDLPSGYSGWQAIDSTPQEVSDDVFCCGPCPVEAIKQGKLLTPHDAPFIFAEVNAHVIYRELTLAGEWVISSIDKHEVGQKLSTKKPTGRAATGWTSIDREDVTHEYKYTDGSKEEARVMREVEKYMLGNAETLPEPPSKQDVTIELVEREDDFIGRGFDIMVKITNNVSETRTIHLNLAAIASTYTGERKAEIKSVKFRKEKIKAEQSREFTMSVTYADYDDKLSEQAGMKIIADGRVLETNRAFTHEDDFRLLKPDLTVEAQGESFKVGEPFTVEISFTNPLSKPLTHCSLDIEGPGLRGETVDAMETSKVLGANATFSVALQLEPRRPGEKTITASFDCIELPDVQGSTKIIVEEGVLIT